MNLGETPTVITASQRVIADQLMDFFEKGNESGELSFPASVSDRDRAFATSLARGLMLSTDTVRDGTPQSTGTANVASVLSWHLVHGG